ncbi:hypothetical protein DM02DRAFT_732978 [Periconia macrospinosa]|uniref:Uncharacterized protein n=1 Tax=Periconia macrospinosa TaxID=97972 RepID=A0A2V1D6H2_9PLEO|nr:hypothetical protein DM02DRAFT_732978 [Periconia macrospinosa]
MSSMIRSDFSTSAASSGSRIGSAESVFGRLTDAKQVTQLSALIGNRARDSSMQINGHIGDKVNNLNFKYLILSCNCEAAKALKNTRSAPPSSATVPVELRDSGPGRRVSHLNSVSATEIPSLGKEKKNVKLFSKATGKPVTFCVITTRRIGDNFISRGLVSRLGFRPHYDRAAVSTIKWGSKRLSSTGYFVDLSLIMPDGAKSSARRFYVVNDPPFDMLIGTNAIEFSRN